MGCVENPSCLPRVCSPGRAVAAAAGSGQQGPHEWRGLNLKLSHLVLPREVGAGGKPGRQPRLSYGVRGREGGSLRVLVPHTQPHQPCPHLCLHLSLSPNLLVASPEPWQLPSPPQVTSCAAHSGRWEWDTPRAEQPLSLCRPLIPPASLHSAIKTISKVSDTHKASSPSNCSLTPEANCLASCELDI